MHDGTAEYLSTIFVASSTSVQYMFTRKPSCKAFAMHVSFASDPSYLHATPSTWSCGTRNVVFTALSTV